MNKDNSTPTPHNEALKGEIAKTVIMPGDPLRAKHVAEKYLKDYKLVNSVRGMYAYTGYYKGNKVTIMAHGMGNPSMGIYSYELFKFYDVENIIRIGSAGSINDNIPLKSVVLVDKTYSLSSYAKVLNNDDSNEMESSISLNDRIIKAANLNNIKLVKSNVFCSDVYYNETEDIKVLREKYNCNLVEMETFALFANAKYLNKKASCVLTVSNSLITGEELPSKERQTGFDEMIKLVLESILV